MREMRSGGLLIMGRHVRGRLERHGVTEFRGIGPERQIDPNLGGAALRCRVILG
jgi:hypothetical protein